MTDEHEQQTFGCEHCWPTSPDAAWDDRRARRGEADLIDESHFHLMLLVCVHCGQKFVSAFSETVDWVDGDDSQYWCVLPLTAPETAQLKARGGALSESELFTLAPKRRSLWRDYPKGQEPRSSWGTGFTFRSHD